MQRHTLAGWVCSVVGLGLLLGAGSAPVPLVVLKSTTALPVFKKGEGAVLEGGLCSALKGLSVVDTRCNEDCRIRQQLMANTQESGVQPALGDASYFCVGNVATLHRAQWTVDAQLRGTPTAPEAVLAVYAATNPSLRQERVLKGSNLGVVLDAAPAAFRALFAWALAQPPPPAMDVTAHSPEAAAASDPNTPPPDAPVETQPDAVPSPTSRPSRLKGK